MEQFGFFLCLIFAATGVVVEAQVVEVPRPTFHRCEAQVVEVPRPTFHRCNWCGINARCIDNSFCRCPTGLTGNPYFVCYSASAVNFCTVCDDPVLSTENDENVAVSYFGNSYLVDKEQERNREQISRLRVYESRKRFRGKSLPRCIRIRIDFKTMAGAPVCSFEVKIFGRANATGDVAWDVESGSASPGGDDVSIQRSHWRTFTHDNRQSIAHRLCDCDTNFYVTRGRILQIFQECSGHIIGVRPFVRRLDWLKSGVFIASARTPPQPLPSPLPSPLPMCLRPGYLIGSVAAALGVQDPRHAMSYAALTSTPDDNVSEISPGQAAMRAALQQCSGSDLGTLFDQVDFITNSAPFIRAICGDTAGYSPVISMMRQAAEWFCAGDVGSCHAMQNTINANASSLVGNPMRYPKLSLFMANGCPP